MVHRLPLDMKECITPLSIPNPLTLKKLRKNEQKAYAPTKDRSLFLLKAAAIAFFIGGGLITVFYTVTLISLFQLSKLIALFSVVGFLIPTKVYRNTFHFLRYEIVLFNLLGITPILTGLFLTVNFVFGTPMSQHNIPITNFHLKGNTEYNSVTLVLDNNAFDDEDKILTFGSLKPSEITSNSSLLLKLGKGLFGYEVIFERTIVSNFD